MTIGYDTHGSWPDSVSNMQYWFWPDGVSVLTAAVICYLPHPLPGLPPPNLTSCFSSPIVHSVEKILVMVNKKTWLPELRDLDTFIDQIILAWFPKQEVFSSQRHLFPADCWGISSYFLRGWPAADENGGKALPTAYHGLIKKLCNKSNCDISFSHTENYVTLNF